MTIFQFPRNTCSGAVIAMAMSVLMIAPVIMTGLLADDSDWNVEALMRELSGVSHAKLDFIETKKSIFLITDTTLEGIMEYRAPDYIEKYTTSPFQERVIIDGDSMLIEKTLSGGKQDEVVIPQTYSVESHPVLKAAVESIRAMLAGNFDVLTAGYVATITGTRENWELNLEPKEAEILEYIESINLSGEDIRITKVVTIQADGDESKLELSYNLLK
jgi:outer membrane lipoprotein-sorting protein